jgi:hypothetical protein
MSFTYMSYEHRSHLFLFYSYNHRKFSLIQRWPLFSLKKYFKSLSLCRNEFIYHNQSG